MDTLKRYYQIMLRQTSLKHVRNLYNDISWNTRLVGIKGARGVGKTTLLLQRILLAFPDKDKAIYVSLDHLWFSTHNLLELAESATNEGITHLFIDEVHRMKGWEQQIKNIYDFFPNLSIVFTGSSLLEIDNSIADLSRRLLLYTLPGLSFREFLAFEGYEFEKLTLGRILYEHQIIASEISHIADIIKLFHKYLRRGYYPFYITETEKDYLVRVSNVITAVIENDIPAVENVEYATLLKAKQLVMIMASQTPSPLNAKVTSESLGVTTNQLLKILSLLGRSRILRLLYYNSERNPKSMVKPNKVIFDNPSLLYALGYADKGKVRESFFASMLAEGHEIGYPREGDLMVDRRYLFEIGGAGKKFTQIKDIPDSFIAADEIEVGYGNKIPLWLFGFLY